MTRVLLTGATGFIGGHIALALLESGYKVRALVRPGQELRFRHPKLSLIEGDVRDVASIEAGVSGCDAVVHAAAIYTFWSRRPDVLYDVNVDGTRKVLQTAVAAGVERIVYTSTVATVKPVKGRLSTEVDTALPGDMVGDYKRSKWEAERIARRMAEAGAPIVVVNPTAPVGPADVKPTPTGQVILDFLRGALPAVVDTGLNLVHVRDVAEGHVLALERGRPGERYLLGNADGNVTLAQMVEMLSKATGLRAPRLKLPHLPVLAFAYADTFFEGTLLRRRPRIAVEAARMSLKKVWVDPAKAVKDLGMPQRPVLDALAEAAEWFTAERRVGGRRFRQTISQEQPDV